MDNNTRLLGGVVGGGLAEDLAEVLGETLKPRELSFAEFLGSRQILYGFDLAQLERLFIFSNLVIFYF